MDSGSRSTWLAAGAAVLALVALILAGFAVRRAMAAAARAAAQTPSVHAHALHVARRASDAAYGARCAAAVALFPSPAAALNGLMPAAAKAAWRASHDPPEHALPALPPWVTAMADGSAMPPALLCLLIDGCTAGQWVQVTAERACYATSPSQGGWAPCAAASVTAAVQEQAWARTRALCQQ